MSTRREPQADQVTDRTPALPALDAERRRIERPSRAAEAAAALETAAMRRRQIELALGRQLRQQAQARMDAQHKTNEAALEGLVVVPPTP